MPSELQLETLGSGSPDVLRREEAPVGSRCINLGIVPVDVEDIRVESNAFGLTFDAQFVVDVGVRLVGVPVRTFGKDAAVRHAIVATAAVTLGHGCIQLLGGREMPGAIEFEKSAGSALCTCRV